MHRPPCPPCPPRDGIALLAVLITLALMGTLAAALFHVATGAQQRAIARRDATRTSVASNAGLAAAFRDYLEFDADSLSIGEQVPARTRQAGTTRVELRGLRTSASTWQLNAFAWFPDTTLQRAALRRSTLDVRLDLPELATVAALTVRGGASVAGSGQVVGTDSLASPLARYCVPGSAVAGVAMPDTTRLAVTGTVSGTPPVQQAPLAALLPTYSAFGAVSFDQLAGRALVQIPANAVVTPAPVVTGAVCDTSVRTNWGEVSGVGPCRRRAPVIHARGSIELRGGSGQGTLLVDGDLTISAGAVFHGLVIVRDDLLTGTGGGTIRGAVLAADTAAGPGNETLVGDGLRLERAACVVQGVLSRHARWRPLRDRAWTPM